VDLKEPESHIDDKYGVDIDETHRVNDILEQQYKDQYSLKITKSDQILEEDELLLCQNKDNCCLILLTLYNLF
jgi:hypothetical protein